MNYLEKHSDGLYYCYDGVVGIIPCHYDHPERIDLYINDSLFEQACISSFDKLDLENEDCYALLQNRKAKVGEWLKSQITERHNTSTSMVKIRLDKHEVYKYIANHPDWFESRYNPNNRYYLTCEDIQSLINSELQKETVCNYTELHGATLTAMVNDGVMERAHYCQGIKCYQYRPILPINEEYKAS